MDLDTTNTNEVILMSDDPYRTIEKLEAQLRRKNGEIVNLTRENKRLTEKLSKTDVVAKDAYILKLTNEISQLKNKKAIMDLFDTGDGTK